MDSGFAPVSPKPFFSKTKIMVILLALLVPGSLLAYLSLTHRVGTVGSAVPSTLETESLGDSTAVYQALAENGILNAVVDIQPYTILVSFVLPADYDETNTAFFVLGLTGAIALSTQTIQVEIWNQNQSRIYTARAQDIQRAARGKISDNELAQLVQVK